MHGSRPNLLSAAAQLLIAGLLASCSDVEEPPPTNPSTAPAPSVREPLDISPYAARPCTAVPDEVATTFQLKRKKEYKDNRAFPDDGVQPACEFSKEGDFPFLMVRLYLSVRPVPLWADRTKALDLGPVHGYPAGTYRVANDEGSDAVAVCTTFVDLATDQGLSVNYNAGHTPDARPCVSASKAADLVVGHLAR